MFGCSTEARDLFQIFSQLFQITTAKVDLPGNPKKQY
jgi:hypothetical protein